MPAPSSPRRFGAHLSVAGGLEHAFQAAVETGCDCLQVFVKNPRQLRAKPLADDAIARFQSAASATLVAPVIAHANYLLNLGSPNAHTREASLVGLVDELERAEALGIPLIVLHPGAHLNATLDDGITHIVNSLDEVHARCAGFKTMILLETTAGQGTSIGHGFDHLRAILTRVRSPERLGACLDTCHLFAAGHDFRTAEGYAAMIDQLDRAISVALVKCIHMNDSKKDCGSRVDRHEHIGKGKIGKDGFRWFVNDPRFAGVPMILETPKGKDGRGTDLDKVNLKRLRSLVDS